MRLKIKIFTMICVLGMILFGTSVYAATFSITPSKTTLDIGDTASVTIKAEDCLGQFSISSSDSSIVSVSSTSKWLENNSENITITAKKAGKATITLTAKNVSDTSGDNDITGRKTATITVSEPKKEEPKKETEKNSNEEEKSNSEPEPSKSSDATLKSITVGGKKYSNPNTSITANSVSADTSSVKIEAQVNDGKAKVNGTGTKELVTGTNKFTLKVTAEDGSTKSYTIKITKLAEEITTPNIVEEDEEEEEKQEEYELRLSSLVIEEVELIPEFNTEVFEYSVYITNINELKIDAKANIEDAKIEIEGNKELKEGENVVLIRLSKDEKNTEYKITVNKAGLSTIQENNKPEIKKTENKISFIGQIKDWWNKAGMQTIIFAGILGLLSAAISFAITVYKYSKPVREESKHLNQEKN